jgi:hypothetical protein
VILRGRKQKNEFEEMFMRQFAGFFEKAQAVTEQLQNLINQMMIL